MGIDPKRSLQYLSPKIAIQWHETKNGSKTASDMTNKVNKTLWWQCSKNLVYEWKEIIANQTQGSGCPECVGKKPKKD